MTDGIVIYITNITKNNKKSSDSLKISLLEIGYIHTHDAISRLIV